MSTAKVSESSSTATATGRKRRWLQFRLRTLLLVPLLLILGIRFSGRGYDQFILMMVGYGAVLGSLWAVGRLWIIGLAREGSARVLPVVGAAIVGGIVAGTIAGPLALAWIERDFLRVFVGWYAKSGEYGLAAFQVASLMFFGCWLGSICAGVGAAIVGPPFAYLAYAASRGGGWMPSDATHEAANAAASTTPPRRSLGRWVLSAYVAMALAVPICWVAWRLWCHSADARTIAELQSRGVLVEAVWWPAGPDWVQARLPIPWLDRVTEIELQTEAMTPNDWHDVAKFGSCCERFEFDLAAITRADFATLADLIAVRPKARWCLTLTGAAIDDRCLSDLRQLPELNSLRLKQSNVTDAGLAHLGTVPVRALFVQGGHVSGAGLAQLARNPSLAILTLTDTDITDGDLTYLAGLPLKSLGLNRTKVAGPGLAKLVAIPALRWLSLADTALSDDDLKHLARISTLESLDLCGCQITDAGLQKLSGLPLLFLFVTDTRVTDDGIAALTEANPRVQVLEVPRAAR